MTLPIEVLMELIDSVNAHRRNVRGPSGEHPPTDGAESTLESLFRTDQRLAVYGSLAPGRQNHHIVQPLGGDWSTGVVEGDLFRYGSGAALGYTAFRPRAGGPAVPVHVLASVSLPAAWAELDEFEGPEYRRVIVPVWSGADPATRHLMTVANLYEAADE